MNLPFGTLLSNPLSALPGRAGLTPEELDRLFAELDSSRQTIVLHKAALHAAELKIQALTLELAHHMPVYSIICILMFQCATNIAHYWAKRHAMITVNIRKQGGAAIITIPADILKMLDVEVGAALELEVAEGAFTARPVRAESRRRYSLAKLLRGVTQEDLDAINEETAWSREGEPVGREME